MDNAPVPPQMIDDLHDISITLKMLLAAVLSSGGTTNIMFHPYLKTLFGDDNERTGTTTEYQMIADYIDRTLGSRGLAQPPQGA